MGEGAREANAGRYWVIGGKRLEAAADLWAWSEVLGPYRAWEQAETMRRRMAAIYLDDPQVQFSVAQDADRVA